MLPPRDVPVLVPFAKAVRPDCPPELNVQTIVSSVAVSFNKVAFRYFPLHAVFKDETVTLEIYKSDPLNADSKAAVAEDVQPVTSSVPCPNSMAFPLFIVTVAAKAEPISGRSKPKPAIVISLFERLPDEFWELDK